MTTSLRPKSLDHVALWVDERDAIAEFAYAHLGMHEIERTDRFTLLGVDARRGKLTLFDAEGPRERGALVRIVWRVGDLAAALANLPFETTTSDGVACFEGPGGVPFGLVERARNDLDYDLDHVVLKASDANEMREGLIALGFEREGDRVAVADKHVAAVNGGAPEGDRPLLNHLAVLVDSAGDVEEFARANGIEVADVVDAKNTIAVFLWGPDRVKVEYVEHKPTFSLV